MKRSILFLCVIVMIITLCACDNISAYKADEDDSYHISSFHSGGEKDITDCSITEVTTMNMLGCERIILQIKTPDDSNEKLPYYELEFTDEEKEDFVFTVYSAKLDTTELVGTDDFDLIDDIRMKSDSGNVKIFAECDESLKFKVEENTDSMQLVICIKEINVKEK